MPGVADAPKTVTVTPDVHRYLLEHGTPPDRVQQGLIADTQRITGDHAGMQIAPEQGALLTMLVQLIGAHRVVEVGTFTGYSALCLARGLPPAPDGRLSCFDISEEWTDVARRYWNRAGVADRIELTVGPAAEGLAALPADDIIDLAFIDADKTGYLTYYELLLEHVRPGGLIIVDNVLWGGDVADEQAQDDNTVAIRAFNDFVAADGRVDTVMLPLADGVTLIRKH